MTSEEFRNFAQGVQAIVFSLAAVCGGGWTIWTMNRRSEIRQSELDIATSERELQMKKGFNRSIEVLQGSALNGKVPLFIAVTIQNTSTEIYTLDFATPPLCLSLLSPNSDGDHEFSLVANLPLVSCSQKGGMNLRSMQQTFMPEQEMTIEFYYEVHDPGTYSVDFVTPVPPSLKAHVFEVEPDQSARVFETTFTDDKHFEGSAMRTQHIFEVRFEDPPE